MKNRQRILYWLSPPWLTVCLTSAGRRPQRAYTVVWAVTVMEFLANRLVISVHTSHVRSWKKNKSIAYDVTYDYHDVTWKQVADGEDGGVYFLTAFVHGDLCVYNSHQYFTNIAIFPSILNLVECGKCVKGIHYYQNHNHSKIWTKHKRLDTYFEKENREFKYIYSLFFSSVTL